ncbi:MAG: glycosyltransferase family 39 protein, partial [Candidatus Aureabacteria bacterium]|nr:glycosyltransferase family 39 protein [Candidatus Auribacterota bacterium]
MRSMYSNVSRSANSRLIPRLVLAAILLIGIALRLFYLGEIRGNPDFDHPAIDAGYHYYWARGITTGNWEAPEGRDDPQIYLHPFYRPPGYAYFLAAIYRLFGVGFLAPRLVQMLLGLLAAGGAYLIGKRWFGGAAGLIWSGLMAVYWIFIFYEGELAGESLSVLLGLPLLWAIAEAGEGRGWARGLIAGVLFGLYALLRPNVLVFFPVAVGWIIWVAMRRPATGMGRTQGSPLHFNGAGGPDDATESPVRGAWITAAAAALGTALAIAPATIRNYVVSGEFVPIATNVGITVAVANNELTDGTTHIIPGIGDIGEPFEYPRIVRQLERNLGRSLTHQAAANYLVGLGVAFARDHPGKFWKLLGRKALLFWGPYEIRNLKETHYVRLNSPVLRSIPLNFPLVFALGVLGAALFFIGWWGEEKRRSLAPLAPLARTIARAARWDDRSPSTGSGSLGRRTMAEGQSDHSLLSTPYSRSSQRQFDIAVLLVLFIIMYFLSMVAFAAADRYRIPLIPFL